MTSLLTRAVANRHVSNPRTVLGFYAAVVGLVGGTAVLLCYAAQAAGRADLLPWILGAAGLLTFGIVIGVFIVNVTRPSNLMLGHITGSEYVEIQRVALGDSQMGERLAVVPVVDVAPSLPGSGGSDDAPAVAPPSEASSDTGGTATE